MCREIALYHVPFQRADVRAVGRVGIVDLPAWLSEFHVRQILVPP
jgi:hypothetical protein